MSKVTQIVIEERQAPFSKTQANVNRTLRSICSKFTNAVIDDVELQNEIVIIRYTYEVPDN